MARALRWLQDRTICHNPIGRGNQGVRRCAASRGGLALHTPADTATDANTVRKRRRSDLPADLTDNERASRACARPGTLQTRVPTARGRRQRRVALIRYGTRTPTPYSASGAVRCAKCHRRERICHLNVSTLSDRHGYDNRFLPSPDILNLGVLG